jgi:hypothetical protein
MEYRQTEVQDGVDVGAAARRPRVLSPPDTPVLT